MSRRVPEDPALKALIEKLQDQSESIIDEVVRGKCRDYAEYKRLCGIISGLSTAFDCLDDIIQEYHLGEDE
jgi:hypothetical protein